MDIRWLAVGTSVGFTLACGSGTSPEDPPRPGSVPDEASSEPDALRIEIPDLLIPFLPPAPVPSEIIAVDGVHRARYDDLSLEAAIRGWNGPIGVVKRTERRVIGAIWSGNRVLLAVVDDLQPGLLVSVHEKVPDLGLSSEGCTSGQISVQVPWPGGAVLSACLMVGASPTPIGPFRIERGGVGVVEGFWSTGGLREGTWTARDDGGEVVVTGAYAASVPIGSWTFRLDGEERSVSYLDGVPTEVPSARLPTSRARLPQNASSTFEILDVDLIAGWVAASERWTLMPEPPDSVRSCPAAGRLDPLGGLRLLLFRPGIREPAGEWTIYDSVLESAPCSTEESAASAIAEANTVFAAYELDPSGKISLIAPITSGDPFRPDAEPTRFEIQGHAVSIRGSNQELSLEDQLREPDLLDGTWVTDTRQVVRSASVSVDGQEVDRLWIRWPRGCPGEAKIEGAIVELAEGGSLVSVVYRSTALAPGAPTIEGNQTCTAVGFLWTIGGPIHLDPPGGGDTVE